MSHFPQPQYLACESCGQAVPRADIEQHTCDEQRWLDYQLVVLRPEIARLEQDFGDWLDTPAGRFEQFYAERRPD
jgi:hypothetical protein